jgi:hypothetical protein
MISCSARLRRVGFCAILALLPFAVAHAQPLHGHVPQAVLSSKSLGRIDPSTPMDLAIGLPLRHQDELENLLQQLADRQSPNYRRYLTADEFAARFGPAEEDYQALADFLGAQGFAVTGMHPNRMILDIRGPVSAIERTFHINMHRWRHAARGDFFAPDREPAIDAGVQILDIAGLDNFIVPRPMNVQTLPLSQAVPLTTGSGPSGLFIGNDFRAAYAPGVTLNGSGQAVGLFELDGFYASDVAANFSRAGVTPVPVQTVLLNGFSGAPGSGNIEVTLDIMMAAYMAPGLSKIIVYEGTSPNDVLNRMATDNQAKQLSSSWAFSPTNATTEQIFKQMIAQGQSLFQASGDSGAYRGWIMPPSDDPNVTVVGGTALTTSGAGGAWSSEIAWSGSGGGVSTVWPIPTWQQSANMTAAGGSSTMRNIPDVALTAAVQMYLIQNNGQAVMVGGTSAAAPLWAGFLALANQQAAAQGKPPVGFLNPVIYRIGAGSSGKTDMHDITAGSNGFSAAPGYDLATGWGTPAGQNLINDLNGLTNGPAFGLSMSVPTLSVAQGSSGTETVTISPRNGFSGAVSLAVSGLPTGVTALFNPASATTTSTLTLNVSNSASPGNSTLAITGTSGSVTGTEHMTLTITGGPGFSLGVSPASLSLAQGASVTGTITVKPLNGFSGSVALAASGLPNGVTASFSPASTSGTSTLTLTAGSSVALGNATVTITGTSGSLHSTATIAVTVAGAPSFAISASPPSLTISPGGSGTNVIFVTAQNGFKGAVAFTASGLPSGVTASFGTPGSSGASVLTLTAGASAPLGQATVTVTGTSGSLRSTATIALAVAAKPGFTLTASPTSLSIPQGGSKTSAITVVPVNSFDGAVSFTASGLPAGVKAAFSPLVAHASTLTFSVDGGAAPGQATVTIGGAAGAITSKTTIALTVTAVPDFTLGASPTSISLTPGGSGGSSISVSGQGGFTGPVNLAVSGLPAGVTATLGSPTARTGSSLTLNASSSAAPGTATVLITGTSGDLTGKVAIALTIAAPPRFGLLPTPSSLSIAPGANGATTIAIKGENGFAGTVSLSVSGLPSGITVGFNSASTTSQSTLTFSAASSASPGTATVTITGTSGSLTSKTAVTLTIGTQPSSSPFALSVTPASLTPSVGTAKAATVTLVPQNGFTGTVTVTVTGVPGGVIPSFGPGPAPGSALLTLLATPSAASGTSTVTIAAKAGGITQTVSVSLTVQR